MTRAFSATSMTSHTLHEILRLIDNVDKKLNLQPTLVQIQEALKNLVASPAATQHQSQLASALATFQAAAEQLPALITPSQFEAIADMGGGDFFDPAIATKVQNSIQTHAMTPSVAKEFVDDLASKRQRFLDTVREALRSLDILRIKGGQLAPGSADVAFLIPRSLFDDKLVGFAKELYFISRLMGYISEAVTGDKEEVKLEQLSSSIPTVAIIASPFAINAMADIVNKFLDAWKKAEEIREVRARVAQLGMRKKALLDDLTQEVTTTVEQVVEEVTETLVAKYPGEEGRKNELANGIRNDTHRLFGQIERGLTVEFRTAPPDEEEEDNEEKAKALSNIANVNKILQFPPVSKEPMLLASGNILDEDIEIAKHTSKKTTTTKATTTKKTTAAEAEPKSDPKNE